MTTFRYRATAASGKIRQGKRTAANENDLAACLGAEGLELIEASASVDAASFLKLGSPIGGGNKLRFLETLCRDLASLLKAGLPFAEALSLTAQGLNSSFGDSLREIEQSVQNGSRLAEAFERHPEIYPPLFRASLMAGEAEGDLASTFTHLADLFGKQEKFRTQTARALRYPLFMLAVALGSSGFMLGFVIPQIALFLSSLGQDLPWPTRFLIGASALVQKAFLPLLFGVFLCTLFLFIARGQNKALCRKSDAFLLKLPLLGPILLHLARARFSGALATLLSAGIGLPEAMLLAADSLTNKALRTQAERARQKLLEGQALSQAATSLFSPSSLQMIKLGEKTGSLPCALEQAATREDEAGQQKLDRLLGMLEPLLTLTVGFLLVWILLATLGPVYGSLGVLGGSR